MSPKVTKRKRRLFTPEFKAEAVRLVRGSGQTVAGVARELDLTATCLRAWVNQTAGDEKGDGQGALTTDERAALTRPRRELRTVEQERDFQKKAAASVAESLFSSFGYELEFEANWRDEHDVERDAAEDIDGLTTHDGGIRTIAISALLASSVSSQASCLMHVEHIRTR